MNKTKILALIAALLLINLSACKKKDEFNPKFPANSNPLIYGDSYFNVKVDGVSMAKASDGYSNAYYGNLGYIVASIKNSTSDSLQSFYLQFTTDQPITVGTYSSALGNLSIDVAHLFRGDAGNTYFKQDLGDFLKITIDSVYGQGNELLLFGKIEGTFTIYNSTQKVEISEGQFGYKLK